MTFHEALDAADVPQAERAVFSIDAHRAWLVVHSSLEVPTARAVMRGLLTVEEIESAQALGGFGAVHGLLVSAGVL